MLPVGAGCGPFHQFRRGLDAGANLPAAAILAAASASVSFLPPSPFLAWTYWAAATAARTWTVVASILPLYTALRKSRGSRSTPLESMIISAGGFLGRPAPGLAPPAFFRAPPLRPFLPAIC